ncbi:MAG: hypothetical protein K8T20_03810, partial [Planctomycetes bacterium]|nr:hypothetical protein [Planctomycetota bacterium]
MSLLDSFGSLFGRRPEPSLPAIPAGKDPMAAMAEAEARRYEMSRAPQPTPESLKAVLAKATRVKVIEGGMWGSRALGTVVRLDTSDPGDLFGLRDRLRIDREPGGHCSCLGGHAMELYADTKLIAVFGLHHGSGLRWDAWKDDARISSPDVFVSWMQAHGIPEPFEELRKNRHAVRVSVAATTKWEAAAPASLKPLLADAARGTIGTTELLLALDAGVADEPEKARQLLKWFGSTGGKWIGAPANQAVPETMLAKFRWQVLVEALMTDDGDIKEDPALLEGAARFISGKLFFEQRAADLGRFSKELKSRLLKHAKDSGEKDKFDQVEAAFKHVVPAPPPATPAKGVPPAKPA